MTRADTVAYLFAYFTGEEDGDDEAVRFAVSMGNDALHWRELHGGRPLLRSTFGEQGLRDPFLLRGSRDDGCYLLATDMSAFRNGWERTQTHGSRAIEIWQSDDLVHWGEQRHVEVSPPTAGNTWAPEAIWDPGRGEYLVYWASNLYPDAEPSVPRDAERSYNRMLLAATRDFRIFTPATVWIDDEQGLGDGTIDSTLLRHDGWVYRSTVVEGRNCPRIDRARDLTVPLVPGGNPWVDPVSRPSPDDGWEPLVPHLGGGLRYPGASTGRERTLDRSEGVILIVPNRDDIAVSGGVLAFVDQAPYYGGEGYVPLWAPSPGASEWSVRPRRQLPRSARHGSVLPITAAEYERLLSAYAPDAVIRVDEVVADTTVGVAPALPVTVRAVLAPGTAQERTEPAVPVTWPARPGVWDRPGTVTVVGTTDGGGLVNATVRVA